jgi:hypothetical protein
LPTIGRPLTRPLTLPTTGRSMGAAEAAMASIELEKKVEVLIVGIWKLLRYYCKVKSVLE